MVSTHAWLAHTPGYYALLKLVSTHSWLVQTPGKTLLHCNHISISFKNICRQGTILVFNVCVGVGGWGGVVAKVPS